MDVDDDGCLSPDDIRRIFRRIERTFAKENTEINIDSSTLLDETAVLRANRKYNWAILPLRNTGQDNPHSLIQWKGYFTN